MLSPAGGERPLTPEEQSRQRTGASHSARTEDRLAGDAVGQQPPVFPEGLTKRVPAGAVHPRTPMDSLNPGRLRRWRLAMRATTILSMPQSSI